LSSGHKDFQAARESDAHTRSLNSPWGYLDHWIPLTTLEQMERTKYDVIIVGTGAGGGAVLWRLCDKWRKTGKRIAVIERGDLVLPTHAMNLPTFDYERMMRFINNPKLKYTIDSSVSSATIMLFAQYFGLGGRTLHWGAGSPRFHPSDFQTWPFTYRELEPYYRIAEHVMGVSQSYAKGSPVQQTLIRRLHGIGFPEATDFPLAINHSTRKNGLHVSAVFSSINFFGYALNTGLFDLAVNARVAEVVTQKGVATGVKVLSPDHKVYVVQGEIVVLSASTLENPRILFQSGIQNDAIGRYLTTHSSVEIEARLASVRDVGNVAVLIPRKSRRPYQVGIYQHHPYQLTASVSDEIPSNEPQHLKIYMHGFGAVEARYDNGVYLRPNDLDEYGIPKLSVQFTFGDRDRKIIRKMISTMKYQAHGLGLRLLGGPRLKPPGSASHESGTCRLGEHPDFSVANQHGELHQVSNLFVADSSVLPYIGAANPTLTIVAVAIRTADHIRHRLGN
jgi:choline dehydrogenase-like flavoprotein